MKWVEFSVRALPEYVEPLSEVFFRYGRGGVAVEESGGYDPDEGEAPAEGGPVIVRTYIPLDCTTEERRNSIDLGVRLVAHFCPISVLQERVLEEEDWQRAWQKHFNVLRIGKRIVVVPSWRKHKATASDVVIELDPGMAFGTGHHPTTRMCLELLEELVSPGVDVLDVGCGSGILSIAAASLGAGGVFGLEIDPVAAEVAQSNVLDNGFAGIARIVHGTLPHLDVGPDGYDLVVANISARVISGLSGELVAAVRQSGALVVSGILRDGSEAVAQALAGAGARVDRSCADGDWMALVASVP